MSTCSAPRRSSGRTTTPRPRLDLSDAGDAEPRLRGSRPRGSSCGGHGAWLGPQFETPAEIRFLRVIGCDLPACRPCRRSSLPTYGRALLGISVVTNMAAGVVEGKLDHGAVLAIGAEAQPRLTALLRALLPELAA